MKTMLAKAFKGQDVVGWLMSEKLDGVRGIWDGKNMMSRNGNIFNLPLWFKNMLPKNIWLDGELYIDRNLFQKTVGVVRTKIPIDSDWENIFYYVFDSPSVKSIFTKRLDACKNVLEGCNVARIVEHKTCNNHHQMDEYFNMLVNDGAEGIMLRNPKSLYEGRRSNNLLKYKPVFTDEAKVVGYNPGTGKNKNKLGSLICAWRDKIICVGSGISDGVRKNTESFIGKTISFQYGGLTNDKMPRFPVYLTVRNYE